MSDPFMIYQYTYDNFHNSNQDSNDLFNSIDSRQHCIKFSHEAIDLINDFDLEEKKPALKTDSSLHEELKTKYLFVNDHSFEMEASPTTICGISGDLSSIEQKNHEQSPKEKDIIEVSNKTICQKSRIEKGNRFETKNICKQLHTETAKLLKNKSVIHQFAPEQVAYIKQFCKSNICIQSFRELLKNAKINVFLQDFYESKYFIREILTSKMEMRSKLAMIKYLQRIRSITYNKNFKTWKKDSKEFL